MSSEKRVFGRTRKLNFRNLDSENPDTKQLENIFKGLVKKTGIENHGVMAWHAGRKLFLRTATELGVGPWSAKLMCSKCSSFRRCLHPQRRTEKLLSQNFRGLKALSENHVTRLRPNQTA